MQGNARYYIVLEITETPDGNLSLGMRQLNGVYTQLFNKRHGRIGHLFQGRYSAILIQKDSHLQEVCSYVVLNPVRARIGAAPEQYAGQVILLRQARQSSIPVLLLIGSWASSAEHGERPRRSTGSS
jgi:REP-associated tyrosine transposase